MRDLSPLLTLAAKHPWYRGANASNRLSDWPVLKKTDLYQRLAEARPGSDPRGSLYYSRSGGTTSGTPLFFPTDVRENHLQRHKLARRLKAARVLSPAHVAVNICPIVRMYRAMEIFTEFGEICGATMLPMAAIAEDDEIFEIAKQFGANTLIGMPSRLVAFARTLHEKNLSLNIETIVFGGEFLQPGKRRLLANVLGTKRFSALYGSAELGIVAWQGDVTDVPIYDFPRDILHVEIVNPDESGYGALVGTNLLRKRFPILRYDTGDVGRIVRESAESVTVELRGRSSDSFLIGDNYHSLGDFATVFADYAEFQIQIRFDDAKLKDVIRFCLVTGNEPISEQKKTETRQRIHAILQGHEIMYLTEVDFVPPAELVRGVGTSKTPAIFDGRGR